MSLRALRKRDTQLSTSSAASKAKATLFRKANSTSSNNNNSNNNNNNNNNNSATTSPKFKKSLTVRGGSSKQLLIQRQLLGRATFSNPELRTFHRTTANHLLRSKSEGDVKTLNLAGKPIGRQAAASAKSEVCLQQISSHSYEPQKTRIQPDKMLGGSRSLRDLSGDDLEHSGRGPRRLSECSGSMISGRRTSSMFTSSMSASQMMFASAPVDPNAPLRVPIIGYEVMEERARFTVYKLRVENPDTNDCWLVMRRYTDFVRLNGKLKQSFPHVNLVLPSKKLFGNNFNAVFLDNRVQGLQMFVNSIMANDQLRKCKLVREFFCLDEPPSYSESMEECRAIFEAQEETIVHLKLQIQHKNDLILSLQQKLREEMIEKEQLREEFKNINLDCSHCSSANDSMTLK
ncbi:sorting nexin-16 [Drosophila grimshawi]|nr:sorting nexin-16 [Drosophila grimshawi]